MRQVNLTCRAPTVPSADERNDLHERIAMRANELDDLATRRTFLEKIVDRSQDVPKQHNLKLSSAGYYRKEGQSGQSTHQGARPVSSATDHHGRPQNYPVEITLHERSVTGKFCFRKRTRRFLVYPQSREMNDPPDTERLTCG